MQKGLYPTHRTAETYCGNSYERATASGKIKRIFWSVCVALKWAMKLILLSLFFPGQCHICGKRFIHSASYNMHKKIHLDERSKKCDICGSEFRYALMRLRVCDEFEGNFYIEMFFFVR